MTRRTPARRSLAFAFAATLVGTCLSPRLSWASEPGPHSPAAAAVTAHVPAPGIGADDVLKRLLEGNRRFRDGLSAHPHEARAWRRRLVTAQHPVATILGCSDSRVPIELLFDQGFGDLFVVRVAGNIIDADSTSGSVEYAALHLGTPLVLVLGHEKCGAVTAALDKSHIGDEPMEIATLLCRILPAVAKVDPTLPMESRVPVAVRANVRQSVECLRKLRSLEKPIAEGRIKVIGAVYNLESGGVEILK